MKSLNTSTRVLPEEEKKIKIIKSSRRANRAQRLVNLGFCNHLLCHK